MLYGSGHVKYTVCNGGAYIVVSCQANEVNYSGGSMTLRKSLQNIREKKVSLWTSDSTIWNSMIGKTVHVHLHCTCTLYVQ